MDYLSYLTQYPDRYQSFSALTERTPNLCRYIREQELFDQGNSFFSIGSGEGALEIALAEEYHSPFEVLEPVPLFVDNFKQLAKEKGVDKQLGEVHPIPFEELSDYKQFDRVLSIHSWYGFGFNKELLQKALSMVKPGGKLFINIMSEKSPVYDLSNMSYSEGIDLCAESLSTWAESEGFLHSFDHETAVRPANLFFHDDGGITLNAKNFASFLMASAWDDLSVSEQQEVQAIFQRHCKDNAVHIVSGCLVFDKR